MSSKYPQLQAFQLYSSGAAIGDTSLVLASMKDIDGVQLSMTDFGDKGFITLDPGAGMLEEQISFSGLTANANGTTTLTGVKTVLCKSPYTETSGIAKQHSGGSSVVVAITSGLLDQFVDATNAETITGEFTFTSTARPKYDTHPTFVADEEIIDKKYADDLAIAGSPNASNTVKGIIEIATGTEISAGASTGGTGALLVPASSSCTDHSVGSASALKIPVTDGTGRIDQSFLNSARTWAAVQSFTADNCQITTDPDSANDAVRKSYLDTQLALRTKYFGDSSDGAFAVTTGTTTWNTSEKYVYQFSSFSLTGDGVLTFGANLQNKRVIVYVDGNLVITSSTVPAVNLNGFGGLGGTSTAYPNAGGSGIASEIYSTTLTSAGSGGGAESGSTPLIGGCGGGGGGMATVGANGQAGSGGSGGASGVGGATSFATNFAQYNANNLLNFFAPGSGGGSGGRVQSNSGLVSGSGGAGGGSIIFIVKGSINITSTMQATGSVGTNGATDGSSNSAGSGGGGGGGSIAILYAGTVIANTPTFTVTGGAGGTAGGKSGGTGGNGYGIVKPIYPGSFNVGF